MGTHRLSNQHDKAVGDPHATRILKVAPCLLQRSLGL
jgi:hypothetical protein